MSIELAVLKYTPRFFKPENARADYIPDVPAAYREGVQLALERNFETAQQILDKRIAHAAVLTDFQKDFRDGHRLGVNGTDEVILRIAIRLINGIISGYYGAFFYSMDQHPIDHRSFDFHWRSVEDGQPLNLLLHGKVAMMKLVDDQKGIFIATAFRPNGEPYEIGLFRPHRDVEHAIAYWKHLRATEQGDIGVFVPHCIIGTDGIEMHPLLMEVFAFASGARDMKLINIRKGMLSKVDWFGPLGPCMEDKTHTYGVFQQWVIDEMLNYLTLEYSGVAGDICEGQMRNQCMKALAGIGYAGRMRFLTDGTASIVKDSPFVRNLEARAREIGVKFINHATPFEV